MEVDDADFSIDNLKLLKVMNFHLCTLISYPCKF